MKRKEIKFRRTRWSLEGRQDGVIYRISEDRALVGTCAPSCSVSAYDTKGQGRTISTAGHRHFHMDAAKEFCQQVAAGEIDLEAMRMEFDAEDAAKEQAAVRHATEKAKQFRAKLEAVGLSYLDLLELEVLRGGLGEMGHQILLGWERGEGLPTAAGTLLEEGQGNVET